MKLTESFLLTRREFPKDEVSFSGKLLIKSGMIYKISNGVYSYLPLGFKVVENIKKIIREEFNKNNMIELLMPSLINENIFEITNRIKKFDKEIIKYKDRNNNNLCLCPTHEELFTIIASNRIKSYKDLHFTMFQISNKYRDEEYTKNALYRKKEFTMCDAYSFDTSAESLDISYNTMYHTYTNILKRLNIDFLVASADNGYMDGNESEEFHAISECADEKIVRCTKCTYTSNIKSAEIITKKEENNTKLLPLSLVETPNIKNVNSISLFLNTKLDNIIKSLIYKVNEKYIMVLMCGNDKVNLDKLIKIFKTNKIRLAKEDEIENLGSSQGFVGPIKSTMKILADNKIKNIVNGVCGSNKKDYHYINVNPNRDFKITKYADIKMFDKNNICPKCKDAVDIFDTIEVAHIFKLGTVYSDKFNLKYTDENNNYNRVYMGSYGIGIDRCLSAIVEHNYDKDGIIWPMDVAPFKVAIVVVNVNDKDAMKYANNLHNKLNDLGIDTLLDDRKETAGIKFKDIDLIGIPIRITIGFKLTDKIIECKLRTSSESEEVNTSDILQYIKTAIENKL